jgi:hypothetical protein
MDAATGLGGSHGVGVLGVLGEQRLGERNGLARAGIGQRGGMLVAQPILRYPTGRAVPRRARATDEPGTPGEYLPPSPVR